MQITNNKESVYRRCFELQKLCNSYNEFMMKCAIEGLDENDIYTESQFNDIHRLYMTYFIHLEK